MWLCSYSMFYVVQIKQKKKTLHFKTKKYINYVKKMELPKSSIGGRGCGHNFKFKSATIIKKGYTPLDLAFLKLLLLLNIKILCLMICQVYLTYQHSG